MTAQDETLRHALSAFLYALPTPLTAESLAVFATNSALQSLMLTQSKLQPERLCHFETLANEGICQNETLNSWEICHFDTLVDALNSYFETLVEAGICQFETIINILIKTKHTLIDKQNSNLPHTPTAENTLSNQAVSNKKAVEGNEFIAASVDEAKLYKKDVEISAKDGVAHALSAPQEWDFNQLLSTANPDLKRRILASNLQQAFLSWLIEANLSQGVHSPLSLAISRSLQTRQPASLPAQRLAQLPASLLSDLLNSVSQRLDAGQTGRFAFVGQGAPDLSLLLQGVEDRATQLRLLRRLLDSLQINL